MSKNPATKTKNINLRTVTLYLFYSSAFLFVLLITAFNFDNYLASNKVLGTQIEASSEEKLFWEDFTQKNPEYLDGWIELSKINFQEGNNNAGASALNKAREIDPNSNRLTEITVLIRH